jgi:UDP-N-acetylmuramoylalanine--D-glutamate ligase
MAVKAQCVAEVRQSAVPTGAGCGRTLVVGLGKTGLSCARFLARQGAEFAVVDSRLEPPGLGELREELPDVPVFLGGFPEEVFARVDRLVVSPGVTLREPAIAGALRRGAEALGDIELFARYADAPVIAITGSNGKSTVTTMLGVMAQEAGVAAAVGGNLGTPALDLLSTAAGASLYILELSSFQLETTSSLEPAAATVLNVSSDHMDRYDDLRAYAAAKRRVFQGGGVMVLNADDPLVMAMREPGRRALTFGLEEPGLEGFWAVRRDGELWLARGGEPLIAAAELRVAGLHNVANALAALALGSAVDLPLAAMLAALRRFAGLAHRTQWVGEADGVRWYNDSKATNVGAALAALRGMAGGVVLIAGGDGKGADFGPLRAAVAEKARAVVLIGRDAPLIEGALGGVVPVRHAADMAQAVALAREAARHGDSVLLSPACASLDMYRNYEHRGEAFIEAVRRLIG